MSSKSETEPYSSLSISISDVGNAMPHLENNLVLLQSAWKYISRVLLDTGLIFVLGSDIWVCNLHISFLRNNIYRRTSGYERVGFNNFEIYCRPVGASCDYHENFFAVVILDVVQLFLHTYNMVVNYDVWITFEVKQTGKLAFQQLQILVEWRRRDNGLEHTLWSIWQILCA